MTWISWLVVGCTSEVLLVLPAATSPAGPVVVEPSWRVEAVDAPNSQRLHVDLPMAMPVDVRCEAGGDPLEVLEAFSPDIVRVHDVTVHGLLTDTTYVCTWRAGSWSGEVAVHTDPAPAWVPTWSVEGTPATGEWTLFSTGRTQGERRQQIIVVDGRGRLRWAHRLTLDTVPDIDASYIGDGQVLFGGGYGVRPTVIDLDQQVLRQAPPSIGGAGYHHHTEQLESGGVVALGLQPHEALGDTWTGFTVELYDSTLTDPLFVWNSTRGVADGWLAVPLPDSEDPYHANSVQMLDDALYVNARHSQRLYKIDRHTGELDWELGAGGDFVLLDEYGEVLTDPGEWFYGAHSPELDGDRLLVHDNGWGRPGEAWSRVLELQLDEQARTAQVLWQWTEPGWYEPIWGDVDRLPNGGVLVTRAHCTRQVDCDLDDLTQIVELGPGPERDVVWRLTLGEGADGGYRAQRLDACEMFHHAGLCP